MRIAERASLICPECRDRLNATDEYVAAMKAAAAKIRASSGPSPFNNGTWRAPGSLRQVVAGVVRYNDLCLVASTGGNSGRLRMPLTVFDCKGIPTSRRARIEGAVVAAGRSLSQPYEAWIAADPLRGGARVLITGPDGFDRTVTFDLAEDPAVITQRVRETIEE